MSLTRLNKSLIHRILSKGRCFSTAASTEDEYTSTPQYPPILDLSLPKRIERRNAAVHEEIKAVKTVEEKQIKLNMPRYYGFKSYMLIEDIVPYDNLTLAQHVTRTHLVKTNELPDHYKNIDVDQLAHDVKLDVEEAILMEFENIRKIHDIKKSDLTAIQREDITSSSVSKQINRVIMTKFSKSHEHILNSEVDVDPRIETCWYAGGMNPPEHVKRCRRGMEWMKEYENEPTDRLMYYIGCPTLTIRNELPLPPVLNYSETDNPALEVPFFKYDPRVVGIKTEHRHMANIPGFWPGDSHGFGLLSFHKRGHILDRHKWFQDAQDDKEALHRQGILSSFAWLHAQANYLGFTTFNDITYPLVTQTVITNGRLWSFYVYQLNTMLLHSKYIEENPKRNLCWASDELKLFEDIVNGKLVGFNDDVFKKLLKFYGNVPDARLGVNLRPYLSQDKKLIADYEDSEKRVWLEREYKFLMSNIPRFKELDEVYSWEKIYKIDNKTRFMDKKLRPFELFKQPHKRRLDDRLAEYIPRALRPDLPRHKGRRAKEFFP